MPSYSPTEQLSAYRNHCKTRETLKMISKCPEHSFLRHSTKILERHYMKKIDELYVKGMEVFNGNRAGIEADYCAWIQMEGSPESVESQLFTAKIDEIRIALFNPLAHFRGSDEPSDIVFVQLLDMKECLDNAVAADDTKWIQFFEDKLIALEHALFFCK